MVKSIVILTIVFVYYCEINAEIHSQNKETATADFQNPLETEKEHADVEHLQRPAETQTNWYTTGSREDNSGLSEFDRSDSEAQINIFFKAGVVNSRKFNKPRVVNRYRFNKVYDVKESTETDESDSENIKLNKRKKYRHHLRKNMTKKHDSANYKGKEIRNKYEKDMPENDSSSENRSKRRFKIKDREDQKKSKYPKNTSMRHEREEDKNKYFKEKSKDKKEEKRVEKAKDGINRLFAETQSSKYDKINKTKQLKGKIRHKQNEPSKKDKSKDDLRLAKSSSAQAHFKTTIKVTKPPQRKHTTTKSTKPKLKSTHEMPREKKGDLRQPFLRSNKPHHEADRYIRSTKLSALSLDDEKKKGHTRPVKKLRQQKDTTKKHNDNGADSALSYLSPYAITTQMLELMKEFPEAHVSVMKSGRTAEYNDIVTVYIKEAANETAHFRTHETKYIDDVPEKKIIFIVHGLTVMGLKRMDSLINLNELGLLISYYLNHLDIFDFILMPLANPDGYSASFGSDRTIWNKNVSPQDVCSGVFLDRNFDVSWNNSHDISSCSQLYPGPSPFSEEESKAVRDVLHRYSHKILAYIHVHAGTFGDRDFKGEAILYPKGYTHSQSDDDKYIDLKGEVDEAMKNASFRVMTVTVDTIANWYGLVHGTSVDYAASVYGIPYAMEFVMQIYETQDDTNGALTEIWSRLIDTTFNNMWKSLQHGTDARRKHFLPK